MSPSPFKLYKLTEIGIRHIDAIFDDKKRKTAKISKIYLKILQKQLVQTFHQLSSIFKSKTNETNVINLTYFSKK